MKKKTIIISAVSVFIALTVAAVGLTFAWYTSGAGADSDYVLEADGVLAFYLTDEIASPDARLVPATARKGAVTDGITEFNVLEVGGDIEKAASTVTHTLKFNYLNAENESSGSAKITPTCTAAAVYEDGTEIPLDLSRELAVKLTVGIVAQRSGDEAKTEGVWGEPFAVPGNAEVSFYLEVYFLQPDDLCSPYLNGAEYVKVTVTATAKPDVEPAA